MSNSPPSKILSVDSCSTRVLANGIDTLFLTLDIIWKDDSLFEQLARAKAEAQFTGDEVPIEFKSWDDEASLFFNLKSHGLRGYEWILSNNEYLLKIGNFLRPGSRPSVFVEIRSETLHKLGTIGAVETILSALVYAKANIRIIRVSRADLYCDILLPDFCWTEKIRKYLVTRATNISWYNRGKAFSGIAIGKNQIAARLYDKALEIKQQSQKTWMYDIWGIKEVPIAHNIIRVEFQLRRERIKELGISVFDDLMELDSNLWVYCTEKWLKLQDRPNKQYKLRHTFEWWKTVQSAYKGSQDATPLVSVKAASQDRDQLLRQLLGDWISIATIDNKGVMPKEEELKSLSYVITRIFPEAKKLEFSPEDLELKIKKRMAKYARSSNGFSKAIGQNSRHGAALKKYHTEQSEIEKVAFNKKNLWEQIQHPMPGQVTNSLRDVG